MNTVDAYKNDCITLFIYLFIYYVTHTKVHEKMKRKQMQKKKHKKTHRSKKTYKKYKKKTPHEKHNVTVLITTTAQCSQCISHFNLLLTFTL